MKRIMLIIFIPLLSLGLCSFSEEKPLEYSKSAEGNNTITSTLAFAVSDRNTNQAMKGVRLIVINSEGQIAGQLTTDQKGDAQKQITVNPDRRYDSRNKNALKSRGTVTVIAYKEGFCDVVLFEVPVTSGSYQPFSMSPVVPGQRNEPQTYIGNNHHLEIISLVEKYRKFLK